MGMYHRERLIALIEKMPSLSDAQKKELADLCHQSQSHGIEVYQAIRGLLAIQAGNFQNMALLKQTRFLHTLHTFLEGGLGQEDMEVFKSIQILFIDRSSGEPHSSASGGIIETLAPKIVDIIRSARFSQVRADAVLALIRLGDPSTLGRSLQDYLPGLLSQNSFSACSVMHFIFHAFGPPSLGPVIWYLLEQDRQFPSMLVGLLEGFCEGNLSTEDHRMDLDQLRIRSDPAGNRALKLEEPIGSTFKDSLSWREHAKAFNAYLRQWDSGTPPDNSPQEGSRKRKAKNTTRRVTGFRELRYRFTRIRSAGSEDGTKEDQLCHISQR